MRVTKRNKILQLFCKHNYQEGMVSYSQTPTFFNLNGDTYTTICVKCGKIKSTRFVRNFDGS